MTPLGRRHVTRIGKRNQVTIPAAMLRELGLAPGERVEVSIDEEGRLAVERVEDPVRRALGFLASARLPHLTDDELGEAVREAVQDAATRRYLRTVPDA
jgi:AbrB family looped-hinge helix DNA binding protein